MRPKSEAQTRKFGDIPLWARVGPITLKNYDFRAELHCFTRSSERGGHHPTITLESPQLAGWTKYFTNHLGGYPWAFQRLVDTQIKEMTVPEEEPQWFDPSFDPEREYPPLRPVITALPGEYERVRAGFASLQEYLHRNDPQVRAREAFTPENIKARYGLTQEQWDAIPDQPEDAAYWRGLRKPGDLP